MNEDTWVPVEGFPGYSVNPLGQVKNNAYNGTHILRTRINQYGVPYVGMMRDGQQCIRSLPLLVAKTFIEKPNRFFDTPINLDGDRTNCHVDNLLWRPRLYAENYVRQFKNRYDHPIDAPVRDIDSGDEFPNSFAAACAFGLLEQEVVLSILNRTVAWPTYQQFELIE